MFSNADQVREYEDAMFSESLSTSQLMGDTASTYHQQGLNCPWDCSACPGNQEPDPIRVADLYVGSEKVSTVVMEYWEDPIEAIRLEARNAATSLGKTVKVVRL